MYTSKVASLALSLFFSVLTSVAQDRPAQASPTSPASAQVRPHYGNVPLMFEANQGQTDSQVRFLSHGNGYSVFLTAGGMVLALRSAQETSTVADASPASAASQNKPRLSPIRQQEKIARDQKSTTLAIDLVGAAKNPTIVGEAPLSTRINYFIGRDPSQWRRNVPTYSQIRYRNVYPGIDLVYYGNNHHVEYDFDLAPGADPANIQFSVKGADALSVDSNDNLVLTKGATQLLFQTPVIYQVSNGTRAPVSGAYTLLDPTHVGFTVADHDNTKPMVIDPVLVYSTFLGGSNDDYSNGIAVDGSGDAYVTGITDSPDFPMAAIGGYSTTQFRMFLTKFAPAGATLKFADYFGGTSGGDGPYAIALDGSGNAYITGNATSTDFPVVNAFQATLSGTQDAFVVEFSADGSTLDYSTYLGGSNSQVGNSIAVDAAGEAIVAGTTQSTDFPMVNAYQPTISADAYGNWGMYGFLTKFAAGGSTLVYSTYLGGNIQNGPSCTGCTFPDSEILGVATDSFGDAYVTGQTTTTNFPVTAGAYATTYPGSGQSDVGFVSEFSTGGTIAYSTYLGGLTSSFLDAIAVDTNGYAYVTGYDIAGDNFPTNTTALCDPSVLSCNGVVVAKLDTAGANLVYSTFLNANNNMVGQAIQVDVHGDAFVVGSDEQFSLTNPIETYTGTFSGTYTSNTDVVVAEIDPTASTQLFATFLGGQQFDAAADSLALDIHGAVYVTGVTQSPDFPVTQSAFQTTWGGGTDAFISKIDPVAVAPAVAMYPYSLEFGSEDIGSTTTALTSILRNMGSATLTITSAATSTDYAETDDCGGTVAPASFCTFSITFSPTVTGDDTGTLTITDTATGSPHVVTLDGTGLMTPFFRISPYSLSFSASPVGTATPMQTVTITNTSKAAISVGGVQVTGDFAATSNGCSSVAANATCKVQVSFTPTSSGTRTGTLRLGSSQTVSLSGSGIDFAASPANASAAVQPGGSATYQLNVGSVGGSFSRAVSFGCSGAPAYATCTVSPGSIVPGSSSSAVTVSVKTAGASAQAHASAEKRGWFLALFAFGQMGIFGVILVSGSRRKFRPGVAAAVMIMLLVLAGCGGTNLTPQSSPGGSNATPAGTYTLSVAATSGNLQHVTKLTLVVQ
jgi:hypothetical protein